MRREYDLVVLGAGPACGPAARLCRAQGWKVAVIESGPLGGVCPHTGCNPKKVLMAAPEAIAAARHLAGRGLVGEPRPDWAALAAFRNAFTDPIDQLVAHGYGEAGIDILRGRGLLTGRNTVQVGQETLVAKKILLAVGATHQQFHFPGAGHLATSDEFLGLHALPDRVVFAGGGFIAFELAHIAAVCGARATILTHGGAVLRRFDQDAVARLLDVTRALGIDVRLNSPIEGITPRDGGLAVQGPDFDIAADMVVNAAGRPPQLAGIGLEAAEVAAVKTGILTNEYLQSTTNPDVYAAGDCLDAPFALTPTADLESRVAGENMLHGNTTRIDRAGTPSVLFTLPPLAMAGLTETDCLRKSLPYVKKEYDLAAAFPWKRLGESAGYAKTLLSPEDDRILGVHILGHAAEEIINVVALAMRQKIPASALRETIWAYPTCGYYLRYMF